jgi:transposase
MFRLMLSDTKWEILENKLHEHGVYETANLRMTVEGILWRLRTGAPWRDLPSEFGDWKVIYNQFNRWSKNGLWEKIFIHEVRPRTGQRVELHGFYNQ